MHTGEVLKNIVLYEYDLFYCVEQFFNVHFEMHARETEKVGCNSFF